MQIAFIRIKNFRALRDVEFPLTASTVIIGENNSGKSSVLDCISLALGRRWGQRGTGFSEYDLSMSIAAEAVEADDSEPPATSIELHFAEDTVGQWPQDVVTELANYVQINPHTECKSIALRVTYTLHPIEKTYQPNWAFIDINGDAIGSHGARRGANANPFFKYVPVFVLTALRDSSEEFSSRSEFWGKLLKAVEISPEQQDELDNEIEALNAKLMDSDPRIANTISQLKEIKSVIAKGAVTDVTIRALPMKLWQLLARSEVVMKSSDDADWLPLDRQGQGLKSLSVIYLFNAFVQRLLAEAYTEHSEPIVALEEPEVHLHPQAARSLWSQVAKMPGQKIVTTHSPYFMQFVPIKSIRILRSQDEGIAVYFVPDEVSAPLPHTKKLAAFIQKHTGSASYDASNGLLVLNGPLFEKEYRELLICFSAEEERNHHPTIKKLRRKSVDLIVEEDLEALEDWARRGRGEIFFSRAWILCEGQTEVFLFSAFFDSIGLNLDVNSVSIIDYQNNGSPRAFASLARVLKFPWILVSDGDDQGDGTIASLKNAAFTDEELDEHAILLPDKSDIESYVVNSALRDIALKTAQEFEASIGSTSSDVDICNVLRANKPLWARRFGLRLRKAPPDESNIPELFETLKDFVIAHETIDDTAIES